MEEMNNNVENSAAFKLPKMKINWELWVSILGLVIVLLPSILLKFLAFNSNTVLTSDSLVAQPAFNSVTVLLGLIFSIYALANAKDNYAIKTIGLVSLVVAVIRLLLQ